MKNLLNTLFVATQGSHVSKDGECVVVRYEGVERARVPVHHLAGVVCFGNILVTPFVLGHCAQNGVTVSFLSEHGRFLGRVVGPVSGNVLLRRRQYRLADDEDAAASIARGCIIGKVANARTVLQRAVRDHGEKGGVDRLDSAIRKLGRLLASFSPGVPLNELRGVEGDAGRIYFDVFDALITSQKSDFQFHARSRRPPLDNVNALLSFIYTLVMHDCVGALESVGLDPQVGFLHRDRPGRSSLALDLMEELRPFFADRLALSLINLRQVQASGFKRTESGAIEMDDDTRRTVLTSYQKRKQDEVRHPFLDESLSVGLLPYAQALLLARHMRGDLDGYPPFLFK